MAIVSKRGAIDGEVDGELLKQISAIQEKIEEVTAKSYNEILKLVNIAHQFPLDKYNSLISHLEAWIEKKKDDKK